MYLFCVLCPFPSRISSILHYRARDACFFDVTIITLLSLSFSVRVVVGFSFYLPLSPVCSVRCILCIYTRERDRDRERKTVCARETAHKGVEQRSPQQSSERRSSRARGGISLALRAFFLYRAPTPAIVAEATPVYPGVAPQGLPGMM